jgi:hypothetical protein
MREEVEMPAMLMVEKASELGLQGALEVPELPRLLRLDPEDAPLVGPGASDSLAVQRSRGGGDGGPRPGRGGQDTPGSHAHAKARPARQDRPRQEGTRW